MNITTFYNNKFLSLPVLLSFLLLQSNISYALPTGQTVVSGTATFKTSGAVEVITASNKAIIDYNTFNIAQPETVSFVQPSASSVVLNRVTGTAPSSILGTLDANGQVFLVNPNGILFGAKSQVNAPGLLASTLDISNSNFLAGKYIFAQKAGSKASYVVNQGQMNIGDGGFAMLLGGAVNNSGSIVVNTGKIALASGAAMTVALNDNISVAVSSAVTNSVTWSNGTKMADAIVNTGTLSTTGNSEIILDADILNNIFDHAINNAGLIWAYMFGTETTPLTAGIELIANNSAGTAASYPGIILSKNQVWMESNSSWNTGKITISSNSGVQETGGWIDSIDTDDTVYLEGAGTFNLQNANNDPSTLTANVNGNINYTQNGQLQVTTAGINSHNHNISLNFSPDQTFHDGSVYIDGLINAGTGSLTIASKIDVQEYGIGSIDASNLLLTGTGNFYLHGSVNNLAANLNGGQLEYTNAGNLTIGTIGLVNGITGVNGSAYVATTNGNLTVLNTAAVNDINLTGETLTLSAGGAGHTLTVNSGANVSVKSGPYAEGIYYDADNMNLLGQSITSTNGTIYLNTVTSTRTTALGGEVAGSLSLTNLELNTLNTGIIYLKSGGTVSLVGNVSLTHPNFMDITSGNQILDTKAATLTMKSLALSAVNGIGTSTTPFIANVTTLTDTTDKGALNVIK